MSQTALATLGAVSGILNLAGSIPYFIAIFRGETKPERATWWMWFSLSVVSLAAQIAGGAKWSLLLSVSSTIVCGATAVLSVTHGYGTFNRRDAMALTITIIGIVMSFAYRSPLIAVLTVLLIDVLATGLTLYKTWLAPYTENLLAWSISIVAVTCGLFAVGDYRPVIFIGPLSNFVINTLMIGVIVYRRSKVTVNLTVTKLNSNGV